MPTGCTTLWFGEQCSREFTPAKETHIQHCAAAQPSPIFSQHFFSRSMAHAHSCCTRQEDTAMSDQHLAPARMQPVGTVRQQQYHQQCSASWMLETHLIVVCLGKAGLHRTRRSVAGIGRHAQHRHPSGGGGSGGGGKAQPVLRRCWPLRGLGIGLRVVLWLPAPEQVAPWARAPEGAREQTQERLAAILSRCAPRSEATEGRGWLIKRPGAHRI